MPETPLRFTFVLTRYGPTVLGGAEKHARDVAERLATRGHDVRVLTTCAQSYTTWANELPAGSTVIAGVHVERFPVARGRIRTLDDIVKAVASTLRTVAPLGKAWVSLQGPIAPELVEACVREAPTRDLMVFFSWLNHPQQRALARIGPRSALVPLVHDEPPVYTSVARQTLRAPRMLLVNTEEEWARIRQITQPTTPPGAIVAVGRETPGERDAAFVPPTHDPYLLVLGRGGKARPVIRLWRELVRLAGDKERTIEIEPGRRVPYDRLKLVVVGEISSWYERVPNLVQLGFVDDATRWQLLRGCQALINPSVHESLSLVLLEAWSVHRPVVVNAACDVTVGQCRRSGGGVSLDFTRPASAAAELLARLSSASDRNAMGERGAAYVERRYQWDRVLDAYEHAARAVRDDQPVKEALAEWAPPTAAMVGT